MTERPSVLGIGTIVKPHGVRGELKLRCAPEHVALLADLCEAGVALVLRPAAGPEREIFLDSVRGSDDAPIIALEGIDDRNAAEGMRGGTLCVDRELLGELEEDEYYLADLNGCDVHDAATGRPIGVVTRAESLPANVVITIKLAADFGGATVYAPLAGDAVPHVDMDARRIDIDCEFLGIELQDGDGS